MDEFYYCIENLFPDREQKLGNCGFFTRLDAKFAAKALRTKMPKQMSDRYNAEGNELLKRTGLKGLFSIMHPYHFWEDTCLLQFCEAPGNACDLGIPPENIQQLQRWVVNPTHKRLLKEYSPLEYHPHNVDSPLQAYVLLGLWTHWANTIRFLIEQNR